MPKVLEVNSIDPVALSPTSAAAFLSLSKRTVFTLIAKGEINAKQCGGRTLVELASVRAYWDALPGKTGPATTSNDAPRPRRRRRKAASNG